MKRETRARGFVVWTVLQLTILAILCAYTSAQIDRGAIVGKVADTSGALIPRATVVVTNKDTGVSATTSSNDAGEYQFSALSPGRYMVKVTATGFQTMVRDNITLHVQDRLSIEAT